MIASLGPKSLSNIESFHAAYNFVVNSQKTALKYINLDKDNESYISQYNYELMNKIISSSTPIELCESLIQLDTVVTVEENVELDGKMTF